MKKLSKGFLKKLSLLAVAASACTIAGVSTVANGEVKEGLNGEFSETVAIGEVVQVPDYYYNSKKATANVITPNGTVISGSKFMVEEGGRYVVEYIVDNTVVYTEDCVAMMSASHMFSVNALASVEGIREYKYQESEEFKGVAVNVKAGASVQVNREIDVTSLTKHNVLFEATVEPRQKGAADFKQMVVTLTDAEDSSSYIRIMITDGHADAASPKYVVFISAAANGQTSGGYNYGKNPPYFQFKDIYGTDIVSSFRAETMESGYSQHSVVLRYDYEENALYTNYVDGQRLVADFDDPVVFGGNVWDGFASGKAVLNVSFTDVKEEGGVVIFNQVAGIPLQKELIEDSVAPDLVVDLGGESKAPNSLLGTNYTIFPCTVKDFFDSNVKVSTSVVYENMFSGAVSDVLVQNNSFVTDKLGRYTIRYTATDYSGNQSVEEVSFDCIAAAEDITLTNIPEDFTVGVFDVVSVPKNYQVRAFGGNGRLTVTSKVIDPEGEEVAFNNATFIPQKLGKYKVIYTATDYYGAFATATLNVWVEANSNTLFMNDIELPKLLVSGFEYTIPEVSAKSCYNGQVVTCTTEYFVNGVKLDDTRTFTAEGGQAEVVCRALANGTVCSEISKLATVVNAQQGKDKAAYFYSADGKMTVEETLLSVDLMASEDSFVEFANSLKGSDFALGVNYLAEDVKFGSFNIILTDAVNSDVSVTLKLIMTDLGVKITTPYGETLDFPSADGYFKLTFDGESGIITDANGSSVTVVNKDDAEKDFVGFGDTIYAKFAFKDVYSASKISLSMLNNQSLGFRSENEDEIGDSKGPEIIVLGDLPVKVSLGSKFTVYAAEAYDVLSQALAPTISVQSPSGMVIVTERPADQDIVVDANEVGLYRVIYTAYDSQGKRTRNGQLINVYDSVAPTLDVTFSDMVKRVGETIALPTFTASDDSGKVYCDVFLSLPSSEMRMLIHSEDGVVTSYLNAEDRKYPASFKVSDNEFKLETKGKYVLTFMAYDDNYNLTMKSFTITVK